MAAFGPAPDHREGDFRMLVDQRYHLFPEGFPNVAINPIDIDGRFRRPFG